MAGHPGLYIQETQPNVVPMQAASTSVAGFVGVAQKGPVNVATMVTSWNDFVRQFGSFITSSYLAYAVQGFFQNGGTVAYIVRSVHIDPTTGDTSKAASVILKDAQTTPANSLQVYASSSGTWGNSLSVLIGSASWGSNYYKLQVLLNGVVVESFDNVTNDPTNQQFVEAIVNGVSNYITVYHMETVNPAVITTPASLTGGVDGLTNINDQDYVGSPSTAPMNVPTGLYALDKVVGGVNLVSIPGITTVTTQLGIQTYVESKQPQTVFAVLDSPMGDKPQDIITYRQTTAGFNSDNMALYYPNVVVPDPIGVGKNPQKIIPPSGHIMGLFSRTDASRGVWKAPAGLQATLLGVIDTEYHVNDNEQDLLNPIGVNCIRTPMPGAGIVVWGARTLTTANPQYNYVPVRRTVQFIENTIRKNLGWAVFEPNDRTLWNRITATVTQFLTGIWQSGGLAGDKASDAFQVVCDQTNNTSATISQGEVIVDIAVAPVNPAEFVTFRIGLKQ